MIIASNHTAEVSSTKVAPITIICFIVRDYNSGGFVFASIASLCFKYNYATRKI